MSVARAIRRRRARETGTEWPSRTMPYRDHGDGYQALHPTKGWRTFSAARLRAQARLAAMVDRINRRMGRG